MINLQKVILYTPVPRSKMFDLKKRASNPQQLEHYVKKKALLVVRWFFDSKTSKIIVNKPIQKCGQ